MGNKEAVSRGVYFAMITVIAILLVICASLKTDDSNRHAELYERYKEADALYEAATEQLSQYWQANSSDGNSGSADVQFDPAVFEEPYNIYLELSLSYPGSYILEQKMSVCAGFMDMYDEMIRHSIRALELYPKLALRQDFMDNIAAGYELLGDVESANRITDYYYDFAAKQQDYP